MSSGREWQFQRRDFGGILVVRDAQGERAVAYLEPAEPGHCVDTGNLIAKLLNEHEGRAH